MAEVTWRWVTGAAAAALLLFGLIEYLDTLPVTSGDLLVLNTRQPYLVAAAIAHIFRRGLTRAALSMLLGALLLTIVWIFAASVGRLATVRALVEYFRRDTAGAGSTTNRGTIRTLIDLNLLRASVVLATVLGLVGAAILAGLGSSDPHLQPAVEILIFLPLAGLVCLIGWGLNGFLSLAAVLAGRDSEPVGGAIVAACRLCRERTGAVLAVSIWTGLLHLTAFAAASGLVTMPMTFASVLPWRIVVLASLFVTLPYFAIADWLYVARLAGYVCIAEMPEELIALPPSPPISNPPQVSTTIDRDEPILSDRPDLTAELT
jgi:hypothetical protein